MSETMTLATQREGQARTMTIAGGADPDRGHWYSPQFVNEYTERMRAENDALRAEVERLAAALRGMLEAADAIAAHFGIDPESEMRECKTSAYANARAALAAHAALPEPPAERGEG